MPSPDVRVRLSAEGVAEVIVALKKVQAEAVKASTTTGAAATKGASGIGSFTSALGGLKGLLGAAGVVATVAGLVSGLRSVGDQALQTADRLGDMAESVGTTPGKLSVLSNLAATSGLSIEQLGTVMAKTATLTTDFENGSASAAATMRQLGISLKDVKGKDTADRVALVAKRVSELRDSAAKTTVVVGALGEKLGPKAIPFLNELGGKGIEGARKELERLGIVLSDRVIANVKRLGDTSERSQSQVVALGSAFLSGASGPIVQGLEVTQEALGTTQKMWEGLGEAIGIVTRTVILLIASLLPLLNIFEGFGTLIGNAAIQLDSFFRQADLKSRGRLAEARAQAKLVEEIVQRNVDAAAKRAQERMVIAGKAIKGLIAGVTGAPTPGAGGGSDVDSEEVKRQREALNKELLELTKSYQEAELRLAENRARREFAIGEFTLREYYAKRRGFVARALEIELEFIDGQRKRALAKAASEFEKSVINQRASLLNSGAASTARDRNEELAAQQLADRLSLAKQTLEVRRSSLTVLGREREVQDALLRLEVGELQRELLSKGAKGDRLDALLSEFAQAKELERAFNNATQDASRALSSLQQDRAEVQAKISAGLLGEVSGAQQLLAIDRERLPKLRELAAVLLSTATESGNPEFIEKAQEFALKIDSIGYAIKAAGDALATFKADFENAFESGLSSFLADGINQVHSLEDAFHSLARSIIADIQRIAAQRLSQSITSSLFGLFSGGMNPLQQQQSYAARLARFADGGYVSGPGTGTSDSIPARLSSGEFVVQSSVVDQPGVRELLMNLNSGHSYDLRPPSFAPIQFDHGDFAGGGVGQGSLTVNLGEGLELGGLDSPKGMKIVVKHIANNRRAIGRLLGGG